MKVNIIISIVKNTYFHSQIKIDSLIKGVLIIAAVDNVMTFELKNKPSRVRIYREKIGILGNFYWKA